MVELIHKRSNWRLRRLELSSLNLFQVPVEVLCSALCDLEEVSLMFARPSLAQMTGLLTGVRERERLTLSKLDLASVDLSRLPAQLLAEAACKLTEINLTGTNLSPDKLVTMFTVLGQTEDVKLQSLNVSYCRLSAVLPPVLCSVVSKLSHVSLHAAHLTRSQSQTLVRELQEMTHLDLGYNDLSSVPSHMVAGLLCRAAHLDVTGCCLTSSQTEDMFSFIATTKQSINLRSLQISNNDLSSISPDTLSKVARKLDVVNFNQTCLTCDQVTFLQNNNVPKDQLKARGLNANDCSLLRNVDVLLENHFVKYEL